MVYGKPAIHGERTNKKKKNGLGRNDEADSGWEILSFGFKKENNDYLLGETLRGDNRSRGRTSSLSQGEGVQGLEGCWSRKKYDTLSWLSYGKEKYR